MLYQHTTLNCQGQLLDLARPRIMGILNITPDSFFDGGRYQTEKALLIQVEKMLSEGADIIDIGGMSSRPGAKLIPVDEELNRVLPAVKIILKEHPKTIISIDTVRGEVARQTIEAGAAMVNDISAGTIDPEMFKIVGAINCPYILMHIQGIPENMQKSINYDGHVVTSVLDFLIEKMGELRALNVKDIVIDPGFGFGKTIDHNYELLKNLSSFRILEVPILVGLSRKSMIHKLLDITAETALNGTTALHFAALENNAKILRVHDVLEARETLTLWEKLKDTPLL